jgi:multicomponent Na+:H+ antiporter subunit C
MTLLLAFLTGGLYAAGIYMMLRRSIVKLAIGLILLSHAANLLIFTAAGIVRAEPPLIEEGQRRLPPGTADPLPQALVLTAIVIGFGVLAFAIALCRRAYQRVRTDDLDQLRTTDT